MKKIPKLRFKEFKDDWQREKLYYLSELIKDGTHGTHKDVKNGIFLLSAKDIKDGKIQIQKDCRKISFNDFCKIHKNYILQNKDLLLTIVGTIGEVGMVENYNRNYTFQRSVAIIRLQKQKLNPKYGLQYFKTNIFQTFLKNKTNSSAQAGVYLGELSKIDMSFPSLEEQKKIADFLSAVDVRIDLTNQKLELLEKYKKGIMQKIFNQELRFKDKYENNYPKWEEKKIEELFKITRGYVLAKIEIKDIRINDYIYPVFSSQTLNNGLMGFYNKYLFENCITWTTDGANAGTVKFRKGKFYCTNVCGVLISDTYNNNCISEILGLETPKHVSYVGNPKLMNNIMSKIKITIPISLEEQQKIADFLSSIDNKIEKLSSKLEELKEFKKGLLQQMFV